MKFDYVFSGVLLLDTMNLFNPRDYFIIKLVSKVFYDNYYFCRDSEDLLERPDLMENKDLKYLFT